MLKPPEATPRPPPAAARAWYAVGVLTLMYAVAALDRQMIALLVQPIRAETGMSDVQLSLLNGFGFVVFYTVFGLPIGYLVDRTSRRGVIYVGMTIWSAAAAACGLARDFPQFLLARMALGAGEAALLPAAYSSVADMFSKRGVTRAIAILATGSAIGAALSMALIGHLVKALTEHGPIQLPTIGELAPWRIAFLAVGLPGAVIALLAWTLPEPPRSNSLGGAKPPLSAAWRFVLHRKGFFIPYFGGYAIAYLASMGFFAWMPSFMIRHHHWDLAQVASFIGVAITVSIPISIVIGAVVQKLFNAGRTDVHLSAYAILTPLAGALVIAGVFSANAYVAMGLFCIAMACMAFIGIASAGLQIVTPSEYRGQVSVLFLLVINLLGGAAAPSVPALFTDYLFHDDSKLGWSIALMWAIAGPAAAVTLWSGRGAARRAVAAAGAWGDTAAPTIETVARRA